MKKHIKTPNSEEFQLERVVFFNDAVFAIAITLLIIDIKVPELHSTSISDNELMFKLSALIPKFIGFVISFFVIGLYWLAHHRMFKFVTAINQRLLWANLLFLLPIVIMPFSTSFLSEYYFSNLRLPFGIYTINICMTGFFSYRLWKIITNPKNKVSDTIDKVIIQYNTARALTIPFIFIFTFLVSFLTTYYFFIPPFIPLTTRLITRHYFKKYPEIMNKYYRNDGIAK
jgi:uncharacterized membrane protein